MKIESKFQHLSTFSIMNFHHEQGKNVNGFLKKVAKSMFLKNGKNWPL